MGNIVTIIGRTNVGKSTLFNRLTQQNIAIVDDIPGVTRDRHYEIAEWCGNTFTIIDTGGYINQEGTDLIRQVNEQIQIAIEESTVILFVLDCKTGLTAEDETLAQKLRKSNKPIIVVANKADNPTRSLEASNFHALGLGDVHEISATHGTGTGDLLDVVVKHLQANKEPIENNIPNIALIGRTNTGKSTFLNTLLGNNRSIVTDQRHTTRVPVHSYYRLYNKELLLIDTAGIAKKNQIPEKSIEFYSLIRTIKAIEQADVCVVFIDAQEGLTQQDKKILVLAHRKKKGTVLLVNKADLLQEEKKTPQYKNDLKTALGFMSYTPILYTSGLYKKNIYQTMEKALEVYENTRKRIATALLNKILQKAIQQQSPPSIDGKPLKINYITQLPISYPMFAIFCNQPNQIPTNYKRYLEKKIRLTTNFEGVPLTFSFRKKSKKNE